MHHLFAIRQLFFKSLFLFFKGGYVSLTSLILVDLLGLDNLSSAFGFLLVFQGVATCIGPPAGGFMFDSTGSYKLPYAVLGSAIMISGLMCYFIPLLPGYKKPSNKDAPVKSIH